MTSAKFQTAVEDSRKLKSKPSDDELLQVSTPSFCEAHLPALQLQPSLISLLWLPNVSHYSRGRRNSMIPHPPTICPLLARPNLSASISPYFRFGIRHTQYDIVPGGQKKITAKIVTSCTLIWGIIAATLAGQLVRFFVFMPPMSAMRLRQSPSSPACRSTLQPIPCD